MKKFFYILSSALILLTSSCQKDGDYIMDHNDKLNYYSASQSPASGVFEMVWSAINTGYVFWDITDVDWDRRYLDYKPKFDEVDSNYVHGKYQAPQEYYDAIQVLYDGLLSGLMDGHMVVRVGTAAKYTSTKPSAKRNKDRAHDDINAAEFRSTFLADLAKNAKVSGFDSCYFTIGGGNYAGHASCVYTLSDGRKIPYLWNSDFVEASSVQSVIASSQDPVQRANAIKWQPIYDRYLDNLINTPKSELGGVILDLRTNGGGAMNSLPNYINIFTGEPKTYWETRYKEGMGRYDMSAWVPFEMGMPEKHRDCAAENIPIVVLCDVNSTSCAEITTGSIKQMPTAHLIGERTWGGHGPLLGYDHTYYNLTYGGVSGNIDMSQGYFIFTSNYENRPVGGPVLEGIGITPDEEVLYKEAGYKGQFDAAVKYLESLK